MLFHVSLATKQLYKSFTFMNSFVQNFSGLIRNSKKFFKHFQNQPLEVFHKESYSQTFVIFIGKHLCKGLFFLIKVAGHEACNFIKKRLQQRHFLVIGKFVRRPIFQENLQTAALLESVLWKTKTTVLLENVFQLRLALVF